LVRRMIDRLQNSHSQSPAPEVVDPPPSYDELLKSELPPPAYHCVVRETPQLRRLFLNSLPWFLRKKALQREGSSPLSQMSPAHRDVSKPSADDYQNDEAWKVSGGGGPRVDSIVVADVPLTDLRPASMLAAEQLRQVADRYGSQPPEYQAQPPQHAAQPVPMRSPQPLHLVPGSAQRLLVSAYPEEAPVQSIGTVEVLSGSPVPVLTPIHQALANLPHVHNQRPAS